MIQNWWWVVVPLTRSRSEMEIPPEMEAQSASETYFSNTKHAVFNHHKLTKKETKTQKSTLPVQHRTVDMCDWLRTELVGMMGFLEAAAAELGLFSSAKGWTFLHDCKYWDIRTDARCLLSPKARVFTCRTHSPGLNFYFQVFPALSSAVSLYRDKMCVAQF